MSYRPFNDELRNSLYNNDPYIVAHLVKFERPSISTNYSGISAERAADYSYMTDAPISIEFDDGSFSRREQYRIEEKALDGSVAAPVPNGIQGYQANKLKSVGTINEGIEAKASTLSIKLDATSVGTSVSAACSFNADQATITTDIDLSEEGFVEGDKILFGGGGTNSGLSVIVNRFTNGGTTLKATTAGGTWGTQNTASLYTITQISEELNTLILGNGNVSYTNYINREVIIYRVHLNPETNEIIGGTPGFYGAGNTYTSGGAMLLFKGIISNASLSEDPKNGTTMTWSLSSHWGDFVKVQNRITQDSDHRALNAIGLPDTNMLLRQEYAGDMGFAHSELALNLIATYNRTETRTKLKKKKKFGGLSKKYTQVEYDVEVPTDVDLKLNLQAKALPVVYGVQKIDSIPFFFDNLKAKPSRVYAGYALCEGSIGGVLDIIIDDKTTICVDKKDSEARSTQTEEASVEVVCQGRQDRGDTLIGTPSSQGVGAYTHTVFESRPGSGRGIRNFFTSVKNYNAEPISGNHYYTQTTRTMDAGGVGYRGIQHEEAFKFTTPIDCTLMFHKGTPYQRANNLLVEKADKNLFKIQNDYFEGNPGSYWTPNHRVLDTAYCIGEYQIGEGETEIPSLDFIVRGRDVECYNYDSSFGHQKSYTSESPANFNAGDTVYITGTGITEYSTTIIDKWSFIDGSGLTQHRFRWATPPTPTGHDVRMSTAALAGGDAGTKWHMLVGGTTLKTGQIDVKLEATFAGTQAAGKFVLNTVPAGWNDAMAAEDTFELDDSGQTRQTKSGRFGLRKSTDGKTNFIGRSAFAFEGYNNSTKEVTGVSYLPADITPDVSEMDVDRLVLRNAIKLPNGGSPDLSNDTTGSIYIGSTITLYRFSSTTGIPYKQEREITAWKVTGTSVVAIVGEPWDADYEPGNGDLFSIKTPQDTRVSINPAMQLLDYMKSERYGKGLKDSDIDLSTFKSAAVACDTRSDVTVITNQPSTLPTVGSVYHRTHSNLLHFRGTVSKVSSFGSNLEITFTDVIGKLAQRWNDYTVFGKGQAIWDIDSLGVTRLKLKTGSTGTVPTFAGSETGNDKSSLNLIKVSGTGGTLVVDGSPDQTSGDGNPIVKSRDGAGSYSASGYSLYDSDNVKYWKYLGWDSRAQRNVTRHQLNQTIETTNTVFENINTMLKQFNGILRYANGSYQLSVKRAAPALSVYEKVVEEDIIGQIKITDKGSKKTYNSISASILDPQNNFESRSVSFFNSEYMRQDNGVPKKGSFSTPGITNYFNARFNIKQFLDESRNGLEIQFTVRPSGLLLLAGEVLALTYGRFGWDEKLWRITNLNFLSNGQVSVTAEEHADSSFVIPASEGSDGVSNKQSGPGIVVKDPSAPPNSLSAVGGAGGIRLTWRHAEGYQPATHDVQVFSNTKDFRTVTTTADGAGSEATSLVVDESTNIAVGTTIADGRSVKTITNGDSYDDSTYEIAVVGDTNWGALDATAETEFSVGDSVVTSGTGTFAGTGQMREKFQTVKVTAVDNDTKTVTLSSPLTWVDGESITFRATLLAGRLDSDTFTDPITEDGPNTTRYYWIRYAITQPVRNIAGAANSRSFSTFHPSTVAGISGTGLSPQILRGLSLTTNNGTGFVYQADGTGIQATYAANTTITSNTTNVLGTATFKYELVNSNGTLTDIGNPSGFSTSSTAVYTPPNSYTDMPQTVRVTLKDTYNGVDYSAVQDITMSAARITNDGTQGVPGSAGISPRTVKLLAGTHSFLYAADGSTPSPSSTTLTATPDNVDAGTIYYKFLKDGVLLGTDTSNETGTGTITYTPQASSSNMPEELEVQLREGSATADILATDRITIGFLQPGVQGADGIDGGDGVDAITTFYNNQSHTVLVDRLGAETWTGSGGLLNIFEGTTELTLGRNGQTTDYPTGNGKYNINITKVSGSTLTEPSVTGAGSVGATIGDFGGNITVPTQYELSILVRVSATETYNPKFNISLTPTFEGYNGATVTAPNLSMVLKASSTGAVASADRFQSLINVVQNGSRLTYSNAISNWSVDTWHFGTIVELTNPGSFAVNTNTSGGLELASSSSFYAANATPLVVEFDVEIKDHNDIVIAILRYVLRKEIGIRDIDDLKLSITGTPTEVTYSGDTFTTYQHSTITTSGTVPAAFTWQASRDWMGGSGGSGNIGHTELGRSTSTSAIKIAASLATPEADGTRILRNGDRFRIEVVEDASAGVHMGATYLAGERIYIGPHITESAARLLTASEKDHNEWSTLVAEKVFGSMIVDGTLSANSINANDIRTKELKVESSIELGTSGTTASTFNRGRIYSAGSSTYANGNGGFFLGWEGDTSIPKFSIGNNSDFLRWNGSTLSIAGTIALTAGSDIAGTSASDVTSGAAAGSTANQDSTSTILASNHTGPLGGVAAITVNTYGTTAGTSTGTSKAFMNNDGLLVTSGGVARVKIGNLSAL